MLSQGKPKQEVCVVFVDSRTSDFVYSAIHAYKDGKTAIQKSLSPSAITILDAITAVAAAEKFYIITAKQKNVDINMLRQSRKCRYKPVTAKQKNVDISMLRQSRKM